MNYTAPNEQAEARTKPECEGFRAGFALPLVQQRPELLKQVSFLRRAQVLAMAVELALRVPGHIMEFGVASGASTRVIRRTLRSARWNPYLPYRHKRIFACDSFEGLPEAFEGAAVGTFAGAIPRIPDVTFVKGYFADTLTDALRQQVGRVAFAHLDADLYSSTRTVLEWLTPLLGNGSLLLFDQFTGDNEAERRAFDEWVHHNNVLVTRIGEFDRDPSGFGRERPDRRVLYQVITQDEERRPLDRSSWSWRISYYLGRVGLDELKSRFDNWAF